MCKDIMPVRLAHTRELNLRLIKLRLPSGKWEVLATSLIDTQRYPAADFGEPYRRRWDIEEGFKLHQAAPISGGAQRPRKSYR